MTLLSARDLHVTFPGRHGAPPAHAHDSGAVDNPALRVSGTGRRAACVHVGAAQDARSGT
ncbi:hypothetical protein [Streptomyces sp. RK62]|uniref:hypothetical protein n=1 Tax=Streptomyces sp. RK62 TaxID=2824893 RepID=UPI001B390B8E|nr:hypothetical protein [Streptomyces sp. RK62]MBQ1000933.1 hypothetical protein [Streptomyces sp. RK62]